MPDLCQNLSGSACPSLHDRPKLPGLMPEAATVSSSKAPSGEVRIVTDSATGKVIRIETVLTDGSQCVLYPLTPEQIEEMEKFLEQSRPATH
jgi:hypothetical protein